MSDFGPALARWVLYGAVSVLVGAASFHWVVLGGSVAPGPERKAAARRTAAGWGVLAALLLIPAMAAVLYFQLESFRDPFEPWSAELQILLSSLWGRVWKIQAGLAVATLVAFIAARRAPSGGAAWWIATGLAFASAAMPAFSGHSFSAERLPRFTIAADVVHLWGAGAWIGTLFVLAACARRHVAGPDGVRGATAEWVRAFSPLALVSFAALALTGLWASWINVGSAAALVGSTYGRTLLLKLVLIAGVVALGAYNWKRVTPVLETDSGETGFLARSARAEVVLGALVLLVTAALVATSLPLDGH